MKKKLRSRISNSRKERKKYLVCGASRRFVYREGDASRGIKPTIRRKSRR